MIVTEPTSSEIAIAHDLRPHLIMGLLSDADLGFGSARRMKFERLTGETIGVRKELRLPFETKQTSM